MQCSGTRLNLPASGLFRFQRDLDMRFKIDENLPIEAASVFQQAGHDAQTVLQQQLGGAPDHTITQVCQREGYALVTLDTDFGDIRAYPPEEFHGIIVLHLQRPVTSNVITHLERLVPILTREPLEGHLWIAEEGRLRIR